uniref:G-protein coupled receptors family 1 profile domain-containing protein n=1 Tax=Monopterus albus TaxID=43700 RepID=A0A3Q3R0F0_MONAL
LILVVFVVAVSQARAMRSYIAAVTLQGSVKVVAKKSEMKAARTLGVVIVVFLICLCPYFCITLSGQDTLMSASSAAFVVCLFYCNSCLNPMVYAFFTPGSENMKPSSVLRGEGPPPHQSHPLKGKLQS